MVDAAVAVAVAVAVAEDWRWPPSSVPVSPSVSVGVSSSTVAVSREGARDRTRPVRYADAAGRKAGSEQACSHAAASGAPFVALGNKLGVDSCSDADSTLDSGGEGLW